MEQFIHYVGLAYFQQPIRAMQFKAGSKAASKQLFLKQLQKAAQRNAARRMLRLKAQRSAAYVWTHLHANAAHHSSSHAVF